MLESGEFSVAELLDVLEGREHRVAGEGGCSLEAKALVLFQKSCQPWVGGPGLLEVGNHLFMLHVRYTLKKPVRHNQNSF
jgi:hypothetical protein